MNAKIPNEMVMEKAEELKAVLSEQLGKPIHGIVVSVLVEEENSVDGLVIYPVSLGRWRSGVATPRVFSKWMASFGEYIFTRMNNEKEKSDD